MTDILVLRSLWILQFSAQLQLEERQKDAPLASDTGGRGSIPRSANYREVR